MKQIKYYASNAIQIQMTKSNDIVHLVLQNHKQMYS